VKQSTSAQGGEGRRVKQKHLELRGKKVAEVRTKHVELRAQSWRK